jgi:hypothetical protein
VLRPGRARLAALATGTIALALLAQTVAAEVRLVQGEVWQRTDTLAKNVAKDPGSRADATFFVSDLNFDSRIAKKGDPTLTDFLGTSQFFNQAGDFHRTAASTTAAEHAFGSPARSASSRATICSASNMTMVWC